MKNKSPFRLLKTLALVITLLITPSVVLAHCDTIDGPVVKAAKEALKTRNINFVLIWVQQNDENEVKQAFRQTLIVRRLSSESRQLADRFFFETVVRLHRAGEGQPFMGLRPAGTNLGPVIPVADRAIENGAVEPLLKLFPDTAWREIADRFNDAITRRKFKTHDIEAGRKYVSSYISLLEYLEHLYERTSSKG